MHGNADGETGVDDDLAARLRLRFSELLTKGRSHMRVKLRQKQMMMALDGDRTMLIWLGKNMLGQSDAVDVTSDGQYVGAINQTGVSPDYLRDVRRTKGRAIPSAT
jgi:hypothetical protein